MNTRTLQTIVGMAVNMQSLLNNKLGNVYAAAILKAEFPELGKVVAFRAHQRRDNGQVRDACTAILPEGRTLFLANYDIKAQAFFAARELAGIFEVNFIDYDEYAHDLYEVEGLEGCYCCRTCGGFEGTLTTDCCGRKLTESEERHIYDLADLDFRAGTWVELSNFPRSPDRKTAKPHIA